MEQLEKAEAALNRKNGDLLTTKGKLEAEIQVRDQGSLILQFLMIIFFRTIRNAWNIETSKLWNFRRSLGLTVNKVLIIFGNNIKFRIFRFYEDAVFGCGGV